MRFSEEASVTETRSVRWLKSHETVLKPNDETRVYGTLTDGKLLTTNPSECFFWKVSVGRISSHIKLFHLDFLFISVSYGR